MFEVDFANKCFKKSTMLMIGQADLPTMQASEDPTQRKRMSSQSNLSHFQLICGLLEHQESLMRMQPPLLER